MLEAVYRAHVNSIEAFVRVRLQKCGAWNRANVADLVQETFTKAFSARGRAAYDGEREYGPFLQRIARNTLIDWLRQNRHRSANLPLEAMTEEFVTPATRVPA